MGETRRYTATGRERRAIRAALHAARAVVQVGKGGLDERVIVAAEEAIASREAIKIVTGRGCPLDPLDAATRLARALDAELIGCTGRTALLYRPAEEANGGRPESRTSNGPGRGPGPSRR